MSKIIKIAEDFSSAPAGRFISDGPCSGENFRENYLVPLLKLNKPITVDLTGIVGASYSFLEEAFGGLIRINKFTVDELKKLLIICPEDDEYCKDIWNYISGKYI
jgi:hypothetical protein